ncbi:MAG: hypothetical protein IT173_02985 [Acidobacteria bacterium]|nr:hypothetical protein [Acidobacteriota bacterium]
MLLTRFPELKAAEGPVVDQLHAKRVDERIFEVWKDLVEQDFSVEEDDDLSF